MKTFRTVQEVLNLLANAQLSMLSKSLEELDDIEFSNIPVFMLTPEIKQIIENYGCILSVPRPDRKAEKDYKFVKIYCIFPSIFRIIEKQ